MRRAPIAAILLAAAFISAPALHAHEPKTGDAVTATPEGRRADLRVFREKFLARDRSYSEAARAEAETRTAALESAADGVSQAYFELEIARIVALADNGHTVAFPGPRSRRYDRVGVRLVPFGEEFYVLRVESEHQDLLGARLISIGGRPLAELRAIARTLVGGTPAWRDRNAGYFFESPQQMRALDAIGADAAYVFQTADGRRIERSLAPEPADPDRPRANSNRWLFPQMLTEEGGAWRAALQAPAPWAFAEPGNFFRWRTVDGLDAIVIDLRENNDSEDRKISDALAEFERAIVENEPRNIVLDMRMNGGGDLNSTRNFMKSLPDRAPGRIFALTSPWTFSAAISSVGYLEQSAPDRVTIVGEMAGDRLNFFSEGDVVTLPNSRIEILNATERHDYETGCRGYKDCHGPVVRNPISVPTLAPDIAAPWTIDAYLAGRDPAMEAVAAVLAEE